MDPLARIAHGYGLPSPRLVERIGERVLRVEVEGREVAAKVFAARDVRAAEVESAILAHLAAPDPRYRVQALVRTRACEPLLRDDDGAVLVTEWAPGVFRPYSAIQAADWRALGAALAALHGRLDSLDAPLPLLRDRFEARDLDAERSAIAALAPEVSAKAPELTAYVAAQLEVLDARGERSRRFPEGPERPIHDDYNQYNYLFEEGRAPLILDWEGATRAPREYEVVRCLNHLPLVGPASAAAFVDGYRSIRGLRKDALRWAIDAALVDHAVKRWAVERWLAGDREAERHVRGSAEILRMLWEGASELEAFYA